MSGLYNLLFGTESNSDFLFAVLGLDPSDFGRFRDIYVTKSHIVVYTRNGGGNRLDYEHVFEEMSHHPLYDFDEDDSFDCTYASIYFRHPEEYHEVLEAMADGTITPTEKWEALLSKLKCPPSKG